MRYSTLTSGAHTTLRLSAFLPLSRVPLSLTVYRWASLRGIESQRAVGGEPPLKGLAGYPSKSGGRRAIQRFEGVQDRFGGTALRRIDAGGGADERRRGCSAENGELDGLVPGEALPSGVYRGSKVLKGALRSPIMRRVVGWEQDISRGRPTAFPTTAIHRTYTGTDTCSSGSCSPAAILSMSFKVSGAKNTSSHCSHTSTGTLRSRDSFPSQRWTCSMRSSAIGQSQNGHLVIQLIRLCLPSRSVLMLFSANRTKGERLVYIW